MTIVGDDRFFLVALIIGVALLLLGIGFIAMLRGRKPKINESPVDGKPAPEWVKSIAGAAGKTLSRTDSVAANVPADAIVVLRDPASDGWVVEVNGLRYQYLKDIHDDKAATKVLQAIGGLQRFAGSIPIVPATASHESAAAPVPIVPAGQSIPFVRPDQVAIIDPVIATALAQGNQTRPKHPAPPGSILDQIEKVLQRNLMKDPVFSQRRIHIGSATDGSLLIEVDFDAFKSTDEVPDERLRNVLKSAIQEWERTA